METNDMRDLDKLTALLDDFGVGYEAETTYAESLVPKVITGQYIECKEGAEKVGGYSMFTTLFKFDKDGNFETMGAWE